MLADKCHVILEELGLAAKSKRNVIVLIVLFSSYLVQSMNVSSSSTHLCISHTLIM